MEVFSFITILLSIVVGLGISHLLVGLASSIRDPDIQRPYWLHSILVIGTILALIKEWWEAWGLRHMTEWNFPTLILLLLPTILMFIAAYVIYPRQDYQGKLEDYYFSRNRLIFGLLALSIVPRLLFLFLLRGTEFLNEADLQTLIVLFGSIVLALTRVKILHITLVPLGVATVLLDVVMYNFSLSTPT